MYGSHLDESEVFFGNVVCVWAHLEQSLKNTGRKKGHIAFMDLEKAYNRVDPGTMKRVLQLCGV